MALAKISQAACPNGPGCCVVVIDDELPAPGAGQSTDVPRPMYQVFEASPIPCLDVDDHTFCFDGNEDAFELATDDYWEIATGRAVFL